MLNKIKNQKGVSLFLALIIMTIFLAMGSGLAVILVSQKKVIRGIDYSVNALFAADTGVEEILYLDKRCDDDIYCNANPTICNEPVCSGADPDDLVTGNLDDRGNYEVTISRNCGLITIESTGSYKEVKRAFEINFGYSLDGKIYLNSASDENCQALCEAIDCTSELIGLDLSLLADGKYYHNPGGGDCASSSGGISTIMGSSPPAGGQTCGGNTTMWSYCKCQGL